MHSCSGERSALRRKLNGTHPHNTDTDDSISSFDALHESGRKSRHASGAGRATDGKES